MSDTARDFGFAEAHRVDWRKVPENLRGMYQRPGFLVRRCYQIVSSFFAECCEPLGLTPSQYSVLYVVNQVRGPTQIDVAKILGLDRSTTGSVVNRLEKHGLLRKVVSASDRRKHTLQLTDDGRKTNDVAQAIVSTEVCDRLLAPLSEEDRDTFVRCLTTIMQAHEDAVRAPVGFEKI